MNRSTEIPSKNGLKPWEFDGFEYEIGAFNYDISKPYRLWFEYLRLSPTYLLAHRHKTAYKGGLTEAQKSTLPDDFDEVLKTYDAFGDVYQYPFRQWWDWYSEKLFGIRSSRLHAHVLAYVAEGHTPNKEAYISAVSNTFKQRFFENNRNAGHILLEVPLADSRAETLKYINEVLDDKFIQPSKISLNAPYKLHGERFHYDALETGLHLLCLRMQTPKTELWKLGVQAGVSNKYGHLDPTLEKLKANMVEPVRVLENLTCRTFKVTTFVMENAARGKFPCKDKIVVPELKYSYMWQIMRRQHQANEKYLKEYANYIKEGKISGTTRFSDWEYNIPEYKQKRDEARKEGKKRFIEEPGQMRLLIVVDKLLTGFDAPSATYLYIDKQMADHNLFQAICRVNRLDGDDKEYGYIVDYKDLFRSLDKAITDYTQGAFDGYDKEDVAGLLKDRLEQAKLDLGNALERVCALCEPVKAPRATQDYIHYFCGESGVNQEALSEKEALRLTLYQNVAKLIRAFANIANELPQAGFSLADTDNIRAEVAHYEKVRDEVKLASGDLLDMKRFEPAMRHLLDMYIRADSSEQLMDFQELGLIELIVEKGIAATESLPESIRKNQDAMAETIENNVRRTIVDENPVNPKYYEHMSVLLDQLIELRRQKAIEYQEYLERIRDLSRKVIRPEQAGSSYPSSMDSQAKRAFYDNFGKDEVLATKIDTTIRYTKKADWVGDRFKEREIANAIRQETAGYDVDILRVMELAKAQKDYH